jgi:hypothetical protein
MYFMIVVPGVRSNFLTLQACSLSLKILTPISVFSDQFLSLQICVIFSDMKAATELQPVSQYIHVTYLAKTSPFLISGLLTIVLGCSWQMTQPCF